MIQTLGGIHRHELSVALTMARLFLCYKTHMDSNQNEKKQEEE